LVFTLVGYSESVALATLQPIAALADQHVTVSGDDLTVPELNHVIGVLAFSANLRQAQLVSPSLRRMWLYDLFPLLQQAALPSEQAVNEGGTATYDIPQGVGFNDLHDVPLELDVAEKLNFYCDNNNNLERTTGLVWLADGVQAPRKGAVFTIKATSSTTLTAYEWTNGTLSFTQTLPAGRYAVVGMAYKSDNAIAARLVFVGGTWRPGCIGQASYEARRPSLFRYGNLGVWGEFEFDQPPTVDFLAAAADTSEEVWLDLIQVRAGR